MVAGTRLIVNVIHTLPVLLTCMARAVFGYGYIGWQSNETTEWTAKESGIDSRRGQEIIFFSIAPVSFGTDPVSCPVGNGNLEDTRRRRDTTIEHELGGPQARSGRVRKIPPPRARSPYPAARTESYHLRFPAH